SLPARPCPPTLPHALHDALPISPPAMLIAMQRDLGLSPTEAVERLVKEEAAARTEQRLHQELGADFAGAWLDDRQQLVVAITDRSEEHTSELQSREKLVCRILLE